MDIHKTIEIIEKSPKIYDMLKCCPYEILKEWTYVEYERGKKIFSQGQVHDYFYIVVEGYLNIYLMSENGKKYSLSIYKKGDYIGELEIFDKSPSSCYVETLSDVKLIKLNRECFLRWIENDSNMSRYITKTLCKQFYNLSVKAGKDNLYSLKQRIYAYLIELIDDKDSKQPIKLFIEKDQLSEKFGVTPRSINRIIQNIKEKGIIEIESSCIIIKDLNKLKDEESNSRYE